MRFLAAFIALLAFAAPGAVHAQRSADLVKSEFIADVDAIKAGQPFHVGVLLKIKPEWHVYWKYPGDSGSPTKVQITAPDGWQVSQLQFPIPKKFNQPGDIIGYGYEDEAMLVMVVTPPADLKNDQPIELTANVTWLACADVCIPGKAERKLSLPVSANPRPANVEEFERWVDRLPATGSNTAIKSTNIRALGEKKFVAAVTLDRSYQDVQWFPRPPEKIAARNAQTSTRGNESTYTFEVLPQPQTAEPMTFLVAYTTADGKRRGVEFMVNLPPTSQSQGGS